MCVRVRACVCVCVCVNTVDMLRQGWRGFYVRDPEMCMKDINADVKDITVDTKDMEGDGWRAVHEGHRV